MKTSVCSSYYNFSQRESNDEEACHYKEARRLHAGKNMSTASKRCTYSSIDIYVDLQTPKYYLRLLWPSTNTVNKVTFLKLFTGFILVFPKLLTYRCSCIIIPFYCAWKVLDVLLPGVGGVYQILSNPVLCRFLWMPRPGIGPHECVSRQPRPYTVWSDGRPPSLSPAGHTMWRSKKITILRRPMRLLQIGREEVSARSFSATPMATITYSRIRGVLPIPLNTIEPNRK